MTENVNMTDETEPGQVSSEDLANIDQFAGVSPEPAPAPTQTAPAPAPAPEPFKAFDIRDMKPEDIMGDVRPEFIPADIPLDRPPTPEEWEKIKSGLTTLDRRMQGERDRTLNRKIQEQQAELGQHKENVLSAVKELLDQGRSPQQAWAGAQAQFQQPQQYPQYDPAALSQMDPQTAQYFQAVSQQNQMLAQRLQQAEGQIANVSQGTFGLVQQLAMQQARSEIGGIFDVYRDKVDSVMQRSGGTLTPKEAFYAAGGEELVRAVAKMSGQKGGSTPGQPAPPFAAPSQAGRGGEPAPSPLSATNVRAASKHYEETGDDAKLREIIDMVASKG